MEASTSHGETDPFVPAKRPKLSSDTNSRTVSEQLHLLTTQIDQFRITSKQALERTKPLFQTFPLANIKQFQDLHTVQQQMAQFFVDLNVEKPDALSYAQLFAGLRMS